MRFVFTSLTVAAVLGVAACANNPNRPTDVGSMQLPSQTGGVAVRESRTPDTGSMQLPPPSGGVVTRETTTPDTGSMALPGAAQGNSLPRGSY
jgi:hypothetical protein